MSASISLADVPTMISLAGNHHGATAVGITRNNSSARADGNFRERVVAECAAIVAEVMDWCWRGGHLAKVAEAKAADFIGIKPRRVKAWRAGEVWNVSAAEAEQLRDAKRRLAIAQIEGLRAELAERMARLSARERECLEMMTPLSGGPTASRSESGASGTAYRRSARVGPTHGSSGHFGG